MKRLIKPVPANTPNKGQQMQIDRKFGMFLHFGVNTFGNVEWSDGSIPAEVYRPESIDAEQWVKTAYEAGMNYVIIITKHHDGFCLWHTKYTDYCVKNSGNPTDVIQAVAEVCKKYNMGLGLYYSLWDRNAKSYTRDFENEYVPYMLNQLEELLGGKYGDIVELWLDGGWDKPRKAWRLDLIYDLVKRLQPLCQVGINHTVGIDDNMGGAPEEYFLPVNYEMYDPIRMYPSDFRLWDPHMCREDDPKIYTYTGKAYYMPFELTICSREGFSWFYSNIYEEKKMLDVDETVNKLRTVFNIDNIAVINMPPNTEGRLCEMDIKHLFEISEKLGIRRYIE